MKTVGRFTVRDMSDTGEGYVGRVMTASDMAGTQTEEARLRRIIAAKDKAGKPHDAEDQQLQALTFGTIRRVNEFLLQAIAELDGDPVDIENDPDDREAVMGALRRLSSDEWEALIKAAQSSGDEAVSKS